MFGHNSFDYALKAENRTSQVAFASDVSHLLEGWEKEGWTLQDIQSYCPNINAGAGSSTSEKCTQGPFDEFTIRGTEGDAMDDERWWWVNANTLGLSNFDGDTRSGACRIIIRDGYKVALKIRFETAGDYSFIDNFRDAFNENATGVIDKNSDSVTVLMEGGDKLSVDIDQDWEGISRFYLSSHGNTLMYQTGGGAIDDEVYITLEDVWTFHGSGGTGGTGGTGGSGNGGTTPCADANRHTNADGSCASSCKTDYEFDSNTGKCVATSDDGEEETNWVLWGSIALGVGVVAFALQ